VGRLDLLDPDVAQQHIEFREQLETFRCFVEPGKPLLQAGGLTDSREPSQPDGVCRRDGLFRRSCFLPGGGPPATVGQFRLSPDAASSDSAERASGKLIMTPGARRSTAHARPLGKRVAVPHSRASVTRMKFSRATGTHNCSQLARISPIIHWPHPANRVKSRWLSSFIASFLPTGGYE
jgi:hypothetical protein